MNTGFGEEGRKLQHGNRISKLIISCVFVCFCFEFLFYLFGKIKIFVYFFFISILVVSVFALSKLNQNIQHL